MKYILLIFSLFIIFFNTSCNSIDITNNNPQYIQSLVDNNQNIRSHYLSAIVIYRTKNKTEAINFIESQYINKNISIEERDILNKAINNIKDINKYQYP